MQKIKNMLKRLIKKDSFFYKALSKIYHFLSTIKYRITHNKEVKKEQEELDMAAQMSKSMSWFMPIMAVSISLIAPLGLALYWLVNNILMIFERLVLNKILDSKKEA